MNEQHYQKSSYREKLIEHLFTGALLKQAWLDGSCALEIAKPEVDNQGYDIIAESKGIIRHIQLKTAHRKANAAKQNVHIALASKPSGCVVWIYFDEDTMELGPFLYYGGRAGEALPSLDGFKIAKHTKSDADGVKKERPAIREIPKAKFMKCATLEELYDQLFSIR